MALEVLVVDDEADIRELVSGVLEDEGYTVRTAADSTATLEAIEERRPSMVLLDVWLQGSRLDGLQLLQEVKRRDPTIPVLMISGHGNLDTAVAAVREGAIDFIEKPFEAERLIYLVDRATETERLRRENETLRRQVGQEDQLHGSSVAINTVRATLEAGRSDREQGADFRPAGRRQGNRRADDPSVEPARQGAVHRAVGGDDESRSGRRGAVRKRNRWDDAPRAPRARPWRHAVPRRDRGHARDHAGQDPSRPHRSELSPRRRPAPGEGRCARAFRHFAQPAGGDCRRALPRGSVLSLERRAGPASRAARAARGHPRARQPFPRALRDRTAGVAAAHLGGGGGGASGARLARQCPPVAQHHRTHPDPRSRATASRASRSTFSPPRSSTIRGR